MATAVKTTFSHANCDHPSTPAARKKCRDNQKKLAEGKIKDTKSVRELQNSLTEAFREQLLHVGSLTASEIAEMLENMTTDAVDEWFSGKLPAMMEIVEKQHKEAMLLTTKYLKEHAALLGYKAGNLDKIGMVWEQVTTSLQVTGPVAFKTHIAAGGTAEAAKEVMKTTLSGSAERLALQGSHDTLTAAVANPNSDVLGYQRETSSKACNYCAGLSKDAIYDSNTFHAHDHCTCTGSPIYLDPRFLPKAAEVDFDQRWDSAVNIERRALELDAAADPNLQMLSMSGIPNEELVSTFGPMIVWKDLTDKAIRNAMLIRKQKEFYYDSVNKQRWENYSLALGHYTSVTYDNMNRFLRGLPRAEHRPMELADEFIHKMNHFLKEYFEKEAVGLPEDYQLYRGVKNANHVFGDFADGDMTGMVFSDKGFVSTSLNKKIADNFQKNEWNPGEGSAPLMMRIIGKKGTRVVGGNGSESEVIFPPNTKFRIIKDYEVDDVGDLGLRDQFNNPIKGKSQRWLDVEVIDPIEEAAKDAKKIEAARKDFDEEFEKLIEELKKVAPKNKMFEKAVENLDSTFSLHRKAEDLAGEPDFKLLSDALDAFQWYLDDGYTDINDYLRRGVVSTPDVLKATKDLVKYFESDYVGKLQQDTATYRGVKSMWKIFGKGWEDNLEGMEFTDKGFYSITTSRSVATDFAKSSATTKDNAVFRIIVPKGTKALKGNDSEQEIVLDASTKFRIVKDRMVGSLRTIDLEIVT